MTVVLEEMGKACFISPFFATVVLGAGAILEAGNEEQKRKYLPGIVEGKSRLTLAVAEISGKYTADAIKMKAVGRGGDFILDGTKLFVPDAHVADYLICAARTGDGITLFIVDIKTPGITVKLLKTIAGDKLCEVTFNSVKVSARDMLGGENKGWLHVEKILLRANVARCAEMVGMAEQALKLTLDYAKERKAFGHPIGAFQSIQHRCADHAHRYRRFQAGHLPGGLEDKRRTAGSQRDRHS